MIRKARASWEPLVGTAGWSFPPREQPRFPGEGSHLERYARVFPAVEINSTFHRPHRESTFARWAESVPAGFRFSLKMPRAITHDAKLVDARHLVDDFLRQIAPLGKRAGCLLAQLPPKLELEVRVARGFLSHLRDAFGGTIALEPRHESWFTPAADRMLERLRVARVAADPPRVPHGSEPGGWMGAAYYRLHGSPRIFYSSYEDDFLEALAARLEALRQAGIPTWCIFDNTTLGAGTGNALALLERLGSAQNKRPAG